LQFLQATARPLALGTKFRNLAGGLGDGEGLKKGVQDAY
jgi:hypothetical protein